MKNLLVVFSLVLMLFQSQVMAGDGKKKTKLELKQAQTLRGGEYKGQKVNKLIGDVIFVHKNTTMYCDSAFQFVGKNAMDAFGHVKMDNGKSQVYGDSLFYDSETGLAKIRGNVRVVDAKSTLTTKFLDYNTKEGKGVYYNGGQIVDKSGAVLKSQRGYFTSGTDTYVFKGNVEVTKEGDRIVSDTMLYKTTADKVFFYGPTYIYSDKNTLYAESGNYDIKKDEARFKKNAWIDSPDYILYGDSLFYRDKDKYGRAKYNVKIFSKKDSTEIYGQEAIRIGKKNSTKIFGDPYMVKRLSALDTLYLAADTLMAVDDTLKHNSDVRAFRNVRILKGEMQGVCDSLVFLEKDSIIFMYKNPIVWQQKNQITADTIRSHLANEGVDRVFADRNAFVVSFDTLQEYNQVKGKNLVAYFDLKSNIEKVTVKGNGECLYFVREKKKQENGFETRELVGMNKIQCSHMIVRFNQNDVTNMTFYSKPDAFFIPDQLIDGPDKRLSKFKWHEEKRPTKEDIIRRKKTI